MHYDVIHSYKLREKCRVDGAIHLWPSQRPFKIHFLTFHTCWCVPDVIWDDEECVFVVRHHLETPMKRKARRRG